MEQANHSPIPSDVFIADAISHAQNVHPSNYKIDNCEKLIQMFYVMTNESLTGSLIDTKITWESFQHDWSAEEAANILFLESDTDFATFVPLALNSFYDGCVSIEKAAEIKKRWPDRFLVGAAVDPLIDGAVDEFERQVELLDPVMLKLYPSSFAEGVHRGWRMDDPAVAFPLFEKARELGIKRIAVHKVMPSGPVPMETYKVGDIDDAASSFPDLDFEIIHGGLAFSEETAWQLARYDNVWVNLDITSLFAQLNPMRFGKILVDLMSIGGHQMLERIIWGTGGGTAAYHPQPCLEAFWNFQIPEKVFGQALFECEPYELTETDRRNILGLNYARMFDLDVDAIRAQTADDEFTSRVEANGGKFSPWSTTDAVLVKEVEGVGA